MSNISVNDHLEGILSDFEGESGLVLFFFTLGNHTKFTLYSVI